MLPIDEQQRRIGYTVVIAVTGSRNGDDSCLAVKLGISQRVSELVALYSTPLCIPVHLITFRRTD